MAFCGFEARYADGTVIRECDMYWNDVPDGIVSLHLREDWEKDMAVVVGPGKVFFYNEVVAFRGGQGVLTGKGIGVIHEGRVREIKFDVSPTLKGMPATLSEREYPESEFSLSPDSLRNAG